MRLSLVAFLDNELLLAERLLEQRGTRHDHPRMATPDNRTVQLLLLLLALRVLVVVLLTVCPRGSIQALIQVVVLSVPVCALEHDSMVVAIRLLMGVVIMSGRLMMMILLTMRAVDQEGIDAIALELQRRQGWHSDAHFQGRCCLPALV